MGSNKPDYAIGQVVTGKLEKLYPYGVFVVLPDESRAYIRRRELSWAGHLDPRTLWQVGQQISGEVIKLAEGQHCLELSHRRTLPDPWLEFGRQFRPGDVVTGTVKSLTGYGAYVEILPGVDGLIPLSELAVWRVEDPVDLVWIGDHIEAVITQLDCPTKRLRLSIRTRMRQLDVIAEVMEGLELYPKTVADAEAAIPAEPPPSLPGPADPASRDLKRVGHILVVDDADEVRQPLFEWLGHQGYTVAQAKNAEEGAGLLVKQPYDVIFVDLNLPGMDGLEFCRVAREISPNFYAVMMSSAEWLAERSSDIEDAGVIEALVKPLDLDEIEHLLTRINQGETLPRWRMSSTSAELKAPDVFRQLAITMRTPNSLTEQFRVGLAQLVADTSAECGLIFRLDPISGAVSISAAVGEIDSFNEEALYGLRESPVRDVIEEKQTLLESRIKARNRQRFRKLLDFIAFESCIGLPLEARGGVHHGLFLFHSRPKAFHHFHLRDALAVGILLEVAIERQAMEERFRSLNKQLLSGQLAGGFSHEVSNIISGLELQLRNLQLDCRLFESAVDETVSFQNIQQSVGQVLETFDSLKNTTKIFQQLMQADEHQRICVNSLIQRVASSLLPILRKKKVRLQADLQSSLPDTSGSTIGLQQAFLNIMLNAIQNMESKPTGSNVLSVATSYRAEEQGPFPLKIRFTDTGWGIHHCLWPKVFDLGFTTRLGGTGQGLYITRSLIHSLGGRVSVEQSKIPLGTTFLVELPLAFVEES
ncbi:MAG TPA: S1 RNA-binding domain-containing protein [Anaerolineae bacterium]|nr:S1 RNA-binding domain-containing protein [Anaerolineae bacterium]HMR62734.1 S1 RNA-binding domain-containing protein [Anaerolineae bacterium]